MPTIRTLKRHKLVRKSPQAIAAMRARGVKPRNVLGQLIEHHPAKRTGKLKRILVERSDGEPFYVYALPTDRIHVVQAKCARK